MYSGTVTQGDRCFAELQKRVPDLEKHELVIGRGVMTVKTLPCRAPWLSGFGACMIAITDIRRGASGRLEFQLGDEHNVPYDNGEAWRHADDFYSEIPQ